MSSFLRVIPFLLLPKLLQRIGAQVQITGASPAGFIGFYVQFPAEFDGGGRIQNAFETIPMNVAQRRVEKAGAHGSIRFQNRGNIGSVAVVGRKVVQPGNGAVVTSDVADFPGRFGDKTAGKIIFLNRYNRFDEVPEAGPG